jgi:hypothetical protein
MQCSHRSTNGTQCEGHALLDSDPPRCVFHPADDEGKARLLAAKRRGGKNSFLTHRKPATLPADVEPLELDGPGSVAAALAAVINDVRAGRIAPAVANSIAVLSGMLLKALDAGDTEERLAKIEKLLNRRRSA